LRCSGRSARAMRVYPTSLVRLVFMVAGVALNPWATHRTAAASWITNGPMAQAREYHTATLLANGTVLVAGGSFYSNGPLIYLASAEVFDPAVGTWKQTGALNAPREFHTATLLPTGKVLVAGGDGGSSILSSAELYDPASGKWTLTGPLNTARQQHTATLLPNGKVLVAGGYGDSGLVPDAGLYDPATGNWTATALLT